MISYNKKIHLIILIIFFQSCLLPKTNEDVARVKTEGVFNPVTFEVIGYEDGFLGYFLIGGDPKKVRVLLRNNSLYDITDIELYLSTESTMGLRFWSEESIAEFPGETGDCQRVLGPGDECEMHLMYIPEGIEGLVEQEVKLNYTNLVERVDDESLVIRLSASAGRPANLITSNEIDWYNFGVRERTFEEREYRQEIEIVNIGGLPARNIDMILQHNSEGEAFYVDGDCGQSILPNESCHLEVVYSSQNYSSSSPDGDEDMVYSALLRFDYLNDPSDNLANYNINFQATSATIEGRLVARGNNPVFEQLVVGNNQTRRINIRNEGFKESVLRKIHFRLGSETIATCVRDNTMSETELTCLDSNQEVLELPDFPFRIVDLDECVTDIELVEDYTNKEVHSSELRYIMPPSEEFGGGELCSFDLTFWPSITYTGEEWPGNSLSNTSILFDYDSTWLDEVTLYGQSSSNEYLFEVLEATYMPAGILSSSLTFDNIDQEKNSSCYDSETGILLTDYLNLSDCINNGNEWKEDYDLGRVALVSSPLYQKNLTFNLENIAGSALHIESITTKGDDGSDFSISNIAATINHYFRSASQINCLEIGLTEDVTCSFQMNLAPLASVLSDPQEAEDEENNWMFDNPDQGTRSFVIRYDDGTSLNDDGTPVELKEVELKLNANLVRVGQLAYYLESASDALASNQNIISGNTEYNFIIIENVGTGSIPYLSLDPVNNLLVPNAGEGEECTDSRPQCNPHPFQIIPISDVPPSRQIDPTTYDHDCRRLILREGLQDEFDDLYAAAFSSGPTSLDFLDWDLQPLLGAGEKCVLAVQVELRESDFDFRSITGSGAQESRPRWRLKYSISQGPNYSIELMTPNISRELSFIYFDGDGVGDADFEPDVEGFGQRKEIFGGEYTINTSFDSPYRIYPERATPSSSAVIYRPEVNLDAILPSDYDWYNQSINVNSPATQKLYQYRGERRYLDLNNCNNNLSSCLSARYIELSDFFSRNDVGNWFDESQHEYMFHAGTFPYDPASSGGDTVKASEVYSLFFRLSGYGDFNPFSSTCMDGGLVIDIEQSQCIDNGYEWLSGGVMDLIESDRIVFTTNDSDRLCFGNNCSFTPGPGSETTPITFNNINRSLNFRFRPNGSSDPAVGYLSYSYYPGLYDESGELLKLTKTVVIIAEETSSYSYPIVTSQQNLPLSLPEREIELSEVNAAASSAEEENTVLFSSIAGSAEPKRKTIRIINDDNEPMRIHRLLFTDNINNRTNNSGLTSSNVSIVSNNCIRRDLTNQGDSCSIVVEFRPVASQSQPLELMGVFNYSIGENQYLSRSFNVHFYPVEPANFFADISETYFVGLNNYYILNFGRFHSSNPIVLVDHPIHFETPIGFNDFEVYNEEVEKGSFLAQYWHHNGAPSCLDVPIELGDECDYPTFNSSNWVTIYEDDLILIDANEPCFYGDDLDDDTIPLNEKGLSSNSSSTCLLRPVFRANVANAWQDYDFTDIENQFSLKYFSVKWESIKEIFFAISASVEPNPSVASSYNYINVQSSDDGRISFSWSEMGDNDFGGDATSSWGPITGYEVLYSELSDDLERIHEENFESVYTGMNQSVVLDGLDPLTYYYIRVAAVREDPNSGTSYLSLDPVWETLDVVVPSIHTFYDHGSNTLVDRYITNFPNIGNRSQAQSWCSQQSPLLNNFGNSAALSKNGNLISPSKRLISSGVIDSLIEDPDLSDYNTDIYMHWLSDSTRNVADVFSEHGPFSSADTFRLLTFDDGHLAYLKSCSTSACDDLHSMWGGDDEFPSNTILYTDQHIGNARCMINLAD